MNPFEIMDCSLLIRMSGLPPAYNLRELRDRIAVCSPDVLYHHFCETPLSPAFEYPDHRNDFAVWASRRLSDKVLLVSVLSLPCLINVKKILNTFRNMGYPPEPNVELVVNRFERRSIISLKEAEESMGKKAFWIVPNDFQLSMNAVNQGKPLSLVDGNAEITKAIRDMAAAVAGRRQGDVKEKEKRAFLGMKL